VRSEFHSIPDQTKPRAPRPKWVDSVAKLCKPVHMAKRLGFGEPRVTLHFSDKLAQKSAL
jgi:hypothetical protein